MNPVAITTREGGSGELERTAVDQLAATLRGPLILPDHPDYESTRQIWNGMIDRRPAVIARCLGTADVIAVVDFAREHDIALSIRGGGHNISGLSLVEGGLLLDNSLMRGVWVDVPGKRAHAQAGCTLGEVDRETQLHGLATVLGFVSNTGIAGLTLGGGFGYLTRKYGWTTDNVLGMDVVTAAGTLVRASADENPDLFWGLCGGGGNFGVVTGIDYQLHAVGPDIFGGAIAWPLAEAEAVMNHYRQIGADSPPELALVPAWRRAPPAPWLDPAVHGQPIVAVFACYAGSADEGQRLLAPLIEHGEPVGNILQMRPYTQQQSLLDATQPNGRRYYWKSDYIGDAPAELTSMLAGHVEAMNGTSAILMFQLDGALAEYPEDHGAVGNRDARAVVNIAAAWDDPAEDEARIAWARQVWNELRPFSTGTYINFLTQEELGDRIHDAYRGNYDRLVDVKTKWDPHNLFRANKNIEPR